MQIHNRMMDINDFSELADGYEPCNPESQPGQELTDWIKEPVDQWILEHGTTDAETVKKARDVWMELGSPVIDPAAPEPPEEVKESMHPEAIRQVTPASVKEYAERLKPMIFEGMRLAMVPLDLLARIESQPVIVGQMFGVPREGGYAPVLVITGTIAGGSIEDSVDQLHGIFHLLNDIYSSNPEEVQVVL